MNWNLKKMHLLVVFIMQSFLFTSLGQVVFLPAKPQAGETVSFSYDPKGRNLDSASVVKSYAFFFDSSLGPQPSGVSISLKKEGNYWQGTFEMSAEENALGAFILFKDISGKIIDSNGGKGFVVFLHTTNGKPLPQSRARFSNALNLSSKSKTSKWYSDKLYQVSLFEQEFTDYPNLKPMYIGFYLNALFESKKENYRTAIINELDQLIISSANLKISTLMLIVGTYKRLEEYEKAEIYAKQIRQLEPDGMFAATEYVEKIAMEQDNDKKISYFKEFEDRLPNSMLLPTMMPRIAYAYIEKQDATNLKLLIERYEKKLPYLQSAQVMSSIAKKMVEENLDLDLAKSYFLKFKDIKNETEPTNDSNEFMLGLIYEKQGKINNAYVCFKNAITPISEKSNLEMNEHYILSAIQLGKKEEAKIAGEQYVRVGKSTEKIREVLRELYTESNGTTGVDLYISQLEKIAKANRKATLTKQMISEPAPQFNLKDIQGNTVSLKDLKGKIIIIDFWATWCGPCVKSFPGMQRMQKKYSNNPNIKFLFVNTWELGENITTKVIEFVTKKGYKDFVVPLDTDGGVATEYKLTGIPAKFVIDTNGNICYKSMGYEGSSEALGDELNAVIDILTETSR